MTALRPLRPRDPQEAHRVASPLELFTDLCYVVAISQASLALHHAVSENHQVPHAVVMFTIAFFGIWWAWLNFAWFNSAYDNDDVLHRVLTLLQVFGSLVLAAGIPRFFDEDFTLGVSGYVIMRVGLVVLWLRAARGHPERAATAHRYAGGLIAVQVLWVAFLFAPHAAIVPLFLLIAVLDVSVPVFAERAGATPWHPHHIAERYGLMFIIVLGETVLSTTVAIQRAVDAGIVGAHVWSVVFGGILIIFSMWWLYFTRESEHVLDATGADSLLWGFGHYLVFGSGAALGAGLAARVDFYDHESHTSDFGSSLFVTGPTVLFLASLWLVVVRLHDSSARTAVPFAVAIAVVAAATFAPISELWAGLACVALLAVELRLTSAEGLVGTDG